MTLLTAWSGGSGATPTCSVVRLPEGGPEGTTSAGGATPAGGRCVFVKVLCCCGIGCCPQLGVGCNQKNTQKGACQDGANGRE